MKYKILISIVLVAVILISGCTSSTDNAKVNNLANCLVEKGVVEYGAFWCPNCAKQEKLFGRSFSVMKDKVYIECDPRCDVADINDLPSACRDKIGQPRLCIEKKINAYPTWDFPNGKRLVGVQDLNSLADEAGCEFNE